MQVLCFSCRKWGREIFENLFSSKEFKDDSIIIITTKKKAIKRIVESISPDVILFYGWSWMISSEITNNYKCIGLHPSPLPKYRGGSPIQNQIQQGETVSAVSLFEITEKLDEGVVLFQEEISLTGFIDDIFKRIIDVGTSGTIGLLLKIKNGDWIAKTYQGEAGASIYKRLKDNSEITIEDLQNMTSIDLYNKIRMLSGFYPTAYIICKDGVKVYIERVRIE